MFESCRVHHLFSFTHTLTHKPLVKVPALRGWPSLSKKVLDRTSRRVLIMRLAGFSDIFDKE